MCSSNAILVLSVTLRNSIYSDARSNATTVACVCLHDHDVEMESDVKRRRRFTRIRVHREADQRRHNLIHASVGQPLVAASENHPLLGGVTAPIS